MLAIPFRTKPTPEKGPGIGLKRVSRIAPAITTRLLISAYNEIRTICNSDIERL
jgi:hypothetical protein